MKQTKLKRFLDQNPELRAQVSTVRRTQTEPAVTLNAIKDVLVQMGRINEAFLQATSPVTVHKGTAVGKTEIRAGVYPPNGQWFLISPTGRVWTGDDPLTLAAQAQPHNFGPPC